MSGAAPVQQRERNDEDVEFDEIEESRSVNGLIYDKVYEVAEKFAGTYVGQYATGKVDRLLKLIEDTAKWSLPQSSKEKSDSSAPLERPLPWIPFIAMILMLRMVRISLSVGGLFIGNSPLVPRDVVYFIQTRRRKLRAIRIVGMRDIRRKEQARAQNQSTGIAAMFRSFLSVVICRPGLGLEGSTCSSNDQNRQQGTSNSGGSEADTIAMLNYLLNSDVVVRTQYGAHPLFTSNTTRSEKEVSASKRQRTEEEYIYDLTLDQIIDKYGEEDSDDDSEFIPTLDDISKANISLESTSSATSDDSDEDEDNQAEQSREDTNPESDAHMANGKRRSENSSSTNENQADDNNVVIRENGEQFSKASRKPVPLPKPHRLDPVPAPIQEVKQEPVDTDEDRSNSQQLQQDPAELKRSTDQPQHQQQQSVVARNDDNVCVNDEPKDKGVTSSDVVKADKKVNGDEYPPIIDHQSEVFLTPATSTEDVFFSPVGSPNVTGSFGYQPTSILKNASAVYFEKRGPTVAYTEEDNPSRAERTTETHATSRPINTTHQPSRGSSHHSARHNKNRFRGRRR